MSYVCEFSLLAKAINKKNGFKQTHLIGPTYLDDIAVPIVLDYPVGPTGLDGLVGPTGLDGPVGQEG